MLRAAATSATAAAGRAHMRRSGAASAVSVATAAATITSDPPPPLIAANVYISEGRRRDALDSIVRAIASTGAVIAPGATPWRGEGSRGDGTGAASPATPPASPSAALLHAFPDAAYNRTGFTLVGTVRGAAERSPPSGACGLTAAVVAAARAGLAAVDLAALRGPGGGDHPTLGSVDHIAVHPLSGGSTLDDAAGVARAVAAALGSEAGDPLAVPAFLYGAAAAGAEKHPAAATLASLRRALGYFRPPLALGGAGGGGGAGGETGFPDPDFGPAGAHAAAAALAAHGRVAVGATPWVVNWNIPLGGPACDAALATAVARAVSSRGGGRLAGVEALALPHHQGGGGGGGGGGARGGGGSSGGGGGGGGASPSSFPWEVATNLRDPASSPPAAVEAEVRAVVDRLGGGGVVVGPGYCTGRDPEALAVAAARALGWG